MLNVTGTVQHFRGKLMEESLEEKRGIVSIVGGEKMMHTTEL